MTWLTSAEFWHSKKIDGHFSSCVLILEDIDAEYYQYSVAISHLCFQSDVRDVSSVFLLLAFVEPFEQRSQL